MKRILWALLLVSLPALASTPFNPIAQSIAITAPNGSSSASETLPGASGADTIQVYDNGSVPITWVVSSVPGAALATSSSTIVPPGIAAYFYIGPGAHDVAVYGIGGAATVYVQAGLGSSGPPDTLSAVGSPVYGHCVEFVTSVQVMDAGAACGSGSITLQTNGANNASQTFLNLTNGNGIALTNPSGGQVVVSTSTPYRVFTGSSDTISCTTDAGGAIQYDSASAITATISAGCTGLIVTLQDYGAGTVTVDPPTGKTVNGGSSFSITQTKGVTFVEDTSGDYQAFSCTACVASGSGVAPNVQFFSASGTWTNPGASYTVTTVDCLGGGGGGGSGAVEAAGTIAGGGAGGGGGAFAELHFPTSSLASSITVTVGAGGTGGAAVSTAGSGNGGANGQNSTFGSLLTAYSGAGGHGGASAANAYGGGGGGLMSGANNQTQGNICGGFGATSSSAGGSGTCGGGGAGGAGSGTTGSGGYSSGPAFLGGAGGASGGGLNSSDVATTGAAGGAAAGAAGGTAGATCGAGGAGSTGSQYGGGSSGGSGGSCATGTGGSAGAGGLGSGGSGGGASETTSGAGANGGNGMCVVISQ
ncbi:MAG TPA: hypothetical protein VFN79_18080 [Steroidobacteraceae bacterium]|nr:hypothetical protein [Steroidobacteraceae bacterium]